MRQSSPFFRAALDKKWQEGVQGLIKLPDDSVEVVTAYLDWLYTKKLEFSQEGTAQGAFWEHLARLYVFGEKIQDDAFCDQVLQAIVLRADGDDNSTPTYAAIGIFYGSTTENAPIRQFIVEYFATFAAKTWFACHLPAEFLRDLAMELVQRRQMKKTATLFSRRHVWSKLKRADDKYTQS